jgi:uncharacterized membrane protein YeaQ/YmgE (transglycosylase-associated protein family)
MGILSWVVLGLVAGIIAKYLMPGKAPGGIVATIILGVLGALLGGLIAAQFNIGDVSGINLQSLLIAVGGAVLLLFLFGLWQKRKL